MSNSATDEFESVNNTGDFEAADWTPEHGWPDDITDNRYPRPAAGLSISDNIHRLPALNMLFNFSRVRHSFRAICCFKCFD